MADKQVNVGGAPVTMGPVGFWLDAAGNVAATDPSGTPQQTPGMRDNPQSAIYYDSGKDLNYTLVNGRKNYQSPVTYDPKGNTIYASSLHGQPIGDTGGGMLHGRPEWNTETGEWDIPIDWGKVGSWAVGGALTAGAANAAMAGAAPEIALTSSAGPTAVANTAAGAATGAAASGGGMGFLDTLKGIYDTVTKGKQIVDAAGNIISPGPSTAGAVGQTAGNIEKGRADALVAAAKLQQTQDQLALNRYVDSLTGQKTALANQGSLAGNSVRGDVLANAQDATIAGLPKGVTVPTLSGGLRPSLLSSASRSLGANMSRQALTDQMSGKYDFKEPPPLTALPTSNTLDTILQGTAGAGGFLNAISGLLHPSNGDNSGIIPGVVQGVTDPSQIEGGLTPEAGATQGIDPSILAWFAQQGQGVPMNG